MFAEAFEHTEDLFEEHADVDAFAGRGVQLGEERSELFPTRADDRIQRGVVERAVQCAQHLHDRAERQCAIGEIEALTDEHQRRLRRPRAIGFGNPGRELGDQP